MGNLIRMDLYRMRKGKGFLVCLILAFVFAFMQTPFAWLLTLLGRMISGEVIPLAPTAPLTEILSNPLPLLNAMLVMLSACAFFYADVEYGYIKNIAGQMPKRGFTILSKFIAIIPHNLLFMLAGVIGNLIGTLIFQRISFEGDIAHSLLVFVLRLLLLQSICSILLLVTSGLQSKPLGTVLAVLLGMGLLGVAYMGIDAGINQLLHLEDFSLARYMPDQLLGKANPPTLDAILVSAVTTAIFLPLSIRVFDRRDVK